MHLELRQKNISPYIIDGHIDISHLSYADDILLLADNLSSMERAFEALQASLSNIGLAIEPSKTEFMIVNQNEKTHSESLKVGSITLPKSDSLKYLGAHFGSSIRATRTLVINELKKKLRKTYGLLAKVKGQFDKYTLGKLYNSMFAPHVFFLTPFWKLFSSTEKKQIRVQFYQFAKFFIGIPLWFRNSYICKKYHVFDISEKMEELSARFENRCKKI